MKTQTTKKAVWMRSILLLPLFSLVLLSFSSKKVILKESNSNSEFRAANFQVKATKKMIDEYNTLANKYNSKSSEVLEINRKDLKRMEYIYHLMTDSQRKNAEPFPVIAPAPPTAPEAPNPPNVPEVIEVVPISKAPKSIEVIEVPPPPPAPKSPVEHIKEMASKGAKFYYNNESISSAQALKLVNTKKKISLVTNHTNDSDYVVRLSSSPIVVKQDN